MLDARLLPFAPLLYLAWSDGALSEEEIGALRAQLDADAGLDRRTRKAVLEWLDPASPPDAHQLAALLETIRRHAHGFPARSRKSLAALGRALARASGEDQDGVVGRALADIEQAIELHIEGLREAGEPIPSPSCRVEYVEVPSAA